MRANQMQAKLFSEQVTAVLQRYEFKQLTSAEVVERLVEIAKQLRDARHRHEQLGLGQEEARSMTRSPVALTTFKPTRG
jgi:type I restriction enzyme R subunit